MGLGVLGIAQEWGIGLVRKIGVVKKSITRGYTIKTAMKIHTHTHTRTHHHCC